MRASRTPSEGPMSPARPIRVFLAVAALALAGAGCGLKPSASDSLRATGGVLAPGTSALGGDGLAAGTGTASGPGTGVSAAGPLGTGVGTAPTGGLSTDGGSGSDGGAAPPGTPSSAPTAASRHASATDRVGVTATTIRIGIHAPITGAAPIPEDSFVQGAAEWWDHHAVFGRKVEVEFQDDQYKPSVARQKCEAMARRDFIVQGAAGTDQIQACGSDPVIARDVVPYFSAGVTTAGLVGLRHYFAGSLTYEEQGPLVLKNAQIQGFAKAGKWALVLSDTPNFDDALRGMSKPLRAAGIPFDVYRTPKYGSHADEARIAQQLAAGRYPVVYFLTAPAFFLGAAQSAHGQLYHPIWTGPGVSMAEGTVAEVGCNGTSGNFDARYLHPYPGVDRATKAFFDAGGGDDIAWDTYASQEALYRMLLALRGDISRDNFINTLERSTVSVPGYPPLRFRPDDHFGGTAAWSLRTDCSKAPPDSSTPGMFVTALKDPLYL
ncbi:MAG: ABC transporter substrate-binding protein [Frankia sp.]|nr:ABC transporter substrate-binding protein [Frankia sp.]